MVICYNYRNLAVAGGLAAAKGGEVGEELARLAFLNIHGTLPA